MDRDELIYKTIQLAVENVQSGRGGPFGALVAKEGQIIAIGTNQVTSTLDPTAHAEVVAIRKACHVIGHFELTGCEIYCSCEPCPMCLGAIYWSRPAQAVHDHIRGLSPFPGAWCELAIDGKPTRLKILRTTLAAGSAPPGTLVDEALTVACGDGAVRILELQRAGRQGMKAEDFLRGQSLPRGTRLT